MRGHLSRAGWLVVLALGGRSIVAAAQAPTVTVGGVGYAQFAYHPTDTANYANTFEVTRAYINAVRNNQELPGAASAPRHGGLPTVSQSESLPISTAPPMASPIASSTASSPGPRTAAR